MLTFYERRNLCMNFVRGILSKERVYLREFSEICNFLLMKLQKTWTQKLTNVCFIFKK